MIDGFIQGGHTISINIFTALAYRHLVFAVYRYPIDLAQHGRTDGHSINKDNMAP